MVLALLAAVTAPWSVQPNMRKRRKKKLPKAFSSSSCQWDGVGDLGIMFGHKGGETVDEVTFEYFQRADVFVVRKIHNVVISLQQAEPVQSVHSMKATVPGVGPVHCQ